MQTAAYCVCRGTHKREARGKGTYWDADVRAASGGCWGKSHVCKNVPTLSRDSYLGHLSIGRTRPRGVVIQCHRCLAQNCSEPPEGLRDYAMWCAPLTTLKRQGRHAQAHTRLPAPRKVVSWQSYPERPCLPSDSPINGPRETLGCEPPVTRGAHGS